MMLCPLCPPLILLIKRNIESESDEIEDEDEEEIDGVELFGEDIPLDKQKKLVRSLYPF